MKILYFTTDFSEQNIAFAQKHKMTMRLANATESSQNLESCDFVYGDEIPERYRNQFAVYELPVDETDLLKARIAELEAQLAALPQNETPKKSKEKQESQS